MKKLILLFVILGTVSCKSTKQTTTPTVSKDNFIVENLLELNAEEIRKKYSDANIKEDAGMFDEGTEELHYTILYGDTPNEIQITWKDAGRTEINDIRFTTAGKWQSSTGIKIGTTYDELNSLNEKPVSFYGFGWDYSGAVMWNDGKMENSSLRVFLAPEKEPQPKYYGDHIIKASPEEIKNMNLKVQTIIYKV